MKATDDLKKAGITEPHAEAISSTLHRVVDNQAATKEELEKTNDALASQGKDLAALKTAQEAQGKDLAALKTAQEAQGKEQVAQGKEQVAQGKDLATLKAGQEKAATKEEVKYLGITLRWAFGILTSAVLLTCFQLYKFQSDVIKVLLANTVNISASKEIPTTMGANDGTPDAGEKPVVAGADDASELDAGAAVMNPPPASETNGAAEPDAGERPAVAGADGASELEAGAAEKPIAAANGAAGLDVAEAESPAGAATAVAAQR